MMLSNQGPGLECSPKIKSSFYFNFFFLLASFLLSFSPPPPPFIISEYQTACYMIWKSKLIRCEAQKTT